MVIFPTYCAVFNVLERPSVDQVIIQLTSRGSSTSQQLDVVFLQYRPDARRNKTGRLIFGGIYIRRRPIIATATELRVAAAAKLDVAKLNSAKNAKV